MKQFILLIIFIKSTIEDCVFHQYYGMPGCQTGSNCQPAFESTTVAEKTPTPLGKEVNLANICPDFTNEDDVCCNAYQISVLASNYLNIQSLFSSQYGGNQCDICSINLQRFYCHFTCSKRQSEFVTISKSEILLINNTINQSVISEINVVVNLETACQLFDSCNKTSYVNEVASMGSTEGFLLFQGNEAPLHGGPFKINFTFVPTNTSSLVYDPYPCHGNYSVAEGVHGYKITQLCQCSSCESACHYVASLSSIDVLTGFNLVVFFIVLGVGAGITLLLFLYMKFRKNNQKETEIFIDEYDFDEENAVPISSANEVTYRT